jgi:hypothetical protein
MRDSIAAPAAAADKNRRRVTMGAPTAASPLPGFFHRIAAIADLVDGLATLVLDRTSRADLLPIDHPNAAGKPSIHLQTSNPLKRRRQVWESSHLAEDGR